MRISIRRDDRLLRFATLVFEIHGVSAAQLLAGLPGAALVWLHYLRTGRRHPMRRPSLAASCTGPAIRSFLRTAQ